MASRPRGRAIRDRAAGTYHALGPNRCVIQVSPAEFLELLVAKLTEEVAEYQETRDLAHLGDVLEVMHAIVHLDGRTWAELEQARVDRATLRGGFAERTVLMETDS